jgi:hypothetical protein
MHNLEAVLRVKDFGSLKEDLQHWEEGLGSMVDVKFQSIWLVLESLHDLEKSSEA